VTECATVEAMAAGAARALRQHLRAERPDLAWEVWVGPVDRAKLARLEARSDEADAGRGAASTGLLDPDDAQGGSEASRRQAGIERMLTRGNCFEYAGKRMLAEPKATSARVVHGTYEVAPGWRDAHGWFEKDGLIWDWQTHGRTPTGRSRFKVTAATPPPVPREEFYRTRKVEVRRSFTQKQMTQAMSDAGHWGPWFDDGGEG